MYSISKEFAFSASHQLNGLPDEHQCARLHGHNYIVIVEISDLQLDMIGFVIDYGKLTPFKNYLDETLDHRHLNDILKENPTAEHLAHVMFDKVKELIPFPRLFHLRVGVSETPKTWAWYNA